VVEKAFTACRLAGDALGACGPAPWRICAALHTEKRAGKGATAAHREVCQADRHSWLALDVACVAYREPHEALRLRCAAEPTPNRAPNTHTNAPVVAKNRFDKSRCPGVAVVEPTDAGKGHDSATARRLNGTLDWRIAIERHVRSVLVVIGDMLADQAEQMHLAKHDQVIKQLAAQCAHPSFRVSVLPRRARRDADLPDAQVVHPRVELAAEDGIAILDQLQRHDVRTDGLHDLLRGPRGVRVCAFTLTCSTRRRSSERTRKT
jgi:hypothetical protein